MTIDNPIDMHNGDGYWLKLRPYQNECLIQIHEGFQRGIKRAAVVLPTGSGKTVIFAHLCGEWRDLVANGVATGRVLILVHRDELIRQTVKKLEDDSPGLRVGVVRANENDHEDRDVIVASVQTVRKLFRLDQIIASGAIGLVVVDECHHAAAESYLTVLNALGCFNEQTSEQGGCVAVGFTATLVRTDKRSLGAVWQEVVYQRDILDMIADHGHGDSPCMPDCEGGYLVNVSGKMVTIDGLSLSQVAMQGGDYAIGSLSDALMSADAPKFAADAWMEHAAGRPGMVFTPTVDTAQAFAAEFSDRGIATAAVWGAMGDDLRRDVLRDAHTGKLQVLVNCMVLTEGFDWPRAEVVMVARPTTSSALYVQMIGRGLRRSPGKGDALVLDLVGASKDHKLATLADLTSRRIENIYEGESLMDAVQREREARNPALADYAVGYEDVDLFQRSYAAWLQTKKGIWFVSTRTSIYFVWTGSEPGLYRLGRRPLRINKGQRVPTEWLKVDVDLETAMSWGSQLATNEDPMYNVASRGASWRRKGPSTAMMNYARRLGLSSQIEPGMNQGEVSTLIDIHIASRMLDKAVR
jgi:superfamily II DNA or RNA helicase